MVAGLAGDPDGEGRGSTAGMTAAAADEAGVAGL
jgi:hypothetical protein